MNPLRFAVRSACALAAILALSACGKSKPLADSNPPAATVTGIATPSNVAVVTATHAN